jgi:hypothetical protein
MTDSNEQTTPATPTDEAPGAGGEPAADPGAASADPGTSGGAGPEGAKAREWLGQLQAMIDDLATQAAPTVRQVGAKAAELAAVAGEKAGPFAQRAAELTGEAGLKLAERSRHLAEELRRDLPSGDGTGEASADEPTAEVPAAEAAAEDGPAPAATDVADEPERPSA